MALRILIIGLFSFIGLLGCSVHIDDQLGQDEIAYQSILENQDLVLSFSETDLRTTNAADREFMKNILMNYINDANFLLDIIFIEGNIFPKSELEILEDRNFARLVLADIIDYEEFFYR